MGDGIHADGEMRARRYHEVVRLAHAGHDLHTLLDEAVRLLRKAVPCEAGCWHTLDPATLLETSYKAVNLPMENPLAAEIEYLHEDYNQFAALARAPNHSGILSVATRGVPERSLRYRELIRPSGLEGELRTTFVSGGAAWGSVCLLREPSSRAFTLDEASFLEAASEHIGGAIRTALLLHEASTDPHDADGPGLVLFDERQRLDAITPSARRLLRDLVEVPSTRSRSPGPELPYVVHAVAARARLAGRVNGAETPARAHVRTRSGRWLALHGCLLSVKARTQIAVIVEHAEPPGLVPAIVDAYELTRREGEVMKHLLQGLSTKQIAATLRISPYTVQEHFTAIFDKVGVRSRRQLVGKVFRRIYKPGHRQ